MESTGQGFLRVLRYSSLTIFLPKFSVSSSTFTQSYQLKDSLNNTLKKDNTLASFDASFKVINETSDDAKHLRCMAH